ncbi:VOC family protein [Roseibium sp. SCP14]|uniref:VOC family protein n=1 Tax=Roseibium sp. SCP14 TaxID=3141375 RepID=UPI00333631B1
MKPGFQVRGLSEIAIHTSNMAAMIEFYRDCLGLEPFATRAGGAIEFFRIGDGFGGLTTVLALFDAGEEKQIIAGRNSPASSLHHIALSVSREEQDAAERWFAEQGVETRTENFIWTGWRGLFVKDPDGNTVELVAAERKPSHFS